MMANKFVTCEGQAAVHENAAHRKEFDIAILAFAAGRPAQQSDLGIFIALKREFTGVMKHQDLLVRLGQPSTGCLEVTRQNVLLSYAGIGEKAISSFSVDPILACIGQTLADSVGEHPQQFAQPFTQPQILESGPRDFLVTPSAGNRGFDDGRFSDRSFGLHPYYPSQVYEFEHFIRKESSFFTQNLWVIASYT